MKKVFAVLLSVTMIAAVFSGVTVRAETYSGDCGDNVTWSFDIFTGTLTVSGTGSMADYDYYEPAPWSEYSNQIKTVNITDGVTSIGESAFEQCFLDSITIANSVKSIGERAFFESGVKSITIPDSVIEIGGAAFWGCRRLTDVTIGCGVEIIESCAFQNCPNLKNIIISDGPNKISIGSSAFCDCESLEEIVIPSNVVHIGDHAFEGCVNLKNITFSDSLNSIGASPFAWTAWYDNQPDGLVYAGKVAYDYKGTCPSSVTIKDGTLGIAGRLLLCLSGITNIIIPDSVVIIGQDALAYCSNLTRVTIGRGVTTVKEWAFSGCESLENVYYRGSESDWKKIIFEKENPFADATVHFNSCIDAAEHSFNDDGVCTVCGYCESVPGDLSGDGNVNSDDAIYLLYHVFFSDAYPISQDCDFTHDGKVTADDAIYLLYHVFFPEYYPI